MRSLEAEPTESARRLIGIGKIARASRNLKLTSRNFDYVGAFRVSKMDETPTPMIVWSAQVDCMIHRCARDLPEMMVPAFIVFTA